jgi:ethanolamine ammonia-lyase small subunit
MNPTISSLIRHGLTAAGGFLVAKGVASADQVGELAGAAVTLLGVILSIIKNKKAAPAPVTPPPTP